MDEGGRQLQEIRQDVANAFDMLASYIKERISKVLQEGAQCFQAGAFPEAEEARQRVESLQGILKKCEDLRRELGGTEEPTPPRQRRRRGKGTSQPDFFQPILETLVNLGGSGQVREVLRGVRGRMDGVLREVDYEPLPSKGEPRWETVACFARLTMVHRGMLKKGSPRGTWEIAEKGRVLVDRKPYWTAEPAPIARDHLPEGPSTGARNANARGCAEADTPAAETDTAAAETTATVNRSRAPRPAAHNHWAWESLRASSGGSRASACRPLVTDAPPSRGMPAARTTSAALYERGRGVRRDRVEAVRWVPSGGPAGE